MDLTPAWSIVADHQDITERCRSHLAGLRVATTTDRTTDTVEITLAGGTAAPRPTGSEIRVSLGYAETGTVDMGAFWHTETEIETAPVPRVVLRATGADLGPQSRIKVPRSRAWDATTLGAVVSAIAAEHGLAADVSAALAAEPIAHIDQSAESDLHLLQRMARRWDAAAKVVGQQLVFAAAGTGRSAANAAMPAVAITPLSGVVSCRVTYRDRPKVAAVRASYIVARNSGGDGPDPIAHALAGTGEPRYDLPDQYADQPTAAAAAAAKLAEFSRSGARLEASMPGQPNLSAGSLITTSGWHPAANGTWITDRVTHLLTTAGYTTELTATAPTPAA